MVRNGRRHATLYDFRDLDLMLKLDAEADEHGYVETEAMARALGFDDDRKPIAQRLAVMRRLGMIEKPPNARPSDPTRWRLSESGLRIIRARIKATQFRTLEAVPDEAMVEVMANITSRYHFTSPTTAAMLRREFLYGTQRR